MHDRLLEKYGDATRVPLKSTEVAPGISKSTLVPIEPVRKFVDKTMPYIGRDGNYYYSLEALRIANGFWKQQNYRKIERK